MINIESNNVDLQLSIIQLYNFYKLNSPPPPSFSFIKAAAACNALLIYLSPYLLPCTILHSRGDGKKKEAAAVTTLGCEHV